MQRKKSEHFNKSNVWCWNSKEKMEWKGIFIFLIESFLPSPDSHIMEYSITILTKPLNKHDFANVTS